MEMIRKVRRTLQGKSTIEGAGVHLKRVFGFSEPTAFDPFLLLDDFRSDEPQYFMKGFPWHPHRGIETITYMLEGEIEHGDSLGNSGVIEPGNVQWMTAGSGIIHQEMPQGDLHGRMGGFQLWANLPASHKLMPPRYREIKSQEIPVVSLSHDVRVRVISGEVEGVKGPVQDIITEPEVLDVRLAAGSDFRRPTPSGHTVIAYVIEGRACFDEEAGAFASDGELVQFEDGELVVARTQGDPARFLLLSGKPIKEPVAWYGPIVMNTQEELRLAFQEYQDGTFIK